MVAVYLTNPSKKNLMLNEYELDSAGIIYPYVANDKSQNVFRVEAEVETEITEANLKQAVKKIYNYFPTFFVKLLKKGKRYVLATTENIDIIEPQRDIICRPFDLFADKPLIRITYCQNKIGIEAFHAVSDGHGLMYFLNILIQAYFNITTGEEFEELKWVILGGRKAKKTENAFAAKFSDYGKRVKREEKSAYQVNDLIKTEKFHFEEISLNSTKLHCAAKKKGVTVTQFLASAYLYSILKQRTKPCEKEISISIPVDMRRMFPSETLRNFSLYIIVGINPKENIWTFDEILKSVKKQFEEKLTKENLSKAAYTNVVDSTSFAFKNSPLALKRIILNMGYKLYGERCFTSTMTSLGNTSIFYELDKKVKAVRLIIGPSQTNAFSCSVISLMDTTRISISSEYDIESFKINFENIIKKHMDEPEENKNSKLFIKSKHSLIA